MTYYVEELELTDEEKEDGEATWDAMDWCWQVKGAGDDIICICATRDEADHISTLLNASPFKRD